MPQPDHLIQQNTALPVSDAAPDSFAVRLVIDKQKAQRELTKRVLEALGRAPKKVKAVYEKGESGLKKAGEFYDRGKRFGELPMTRKEDFADMQKDSESEPNLRGMSSAHGKRALAENPEWMSRALAQSGGLDKLSQASAYSDNAKERDEQKKNAEHSIHRDYSEHSFAGRRSAQDGEKASLGAPGKGKNVAGKIAGAGIGAIVEGGGIPSAVFLYGLALLNDFPDIADPFLKFFTGDLAAIVDFLFDVFVFLGFRYFLRNHINIPGIKAWLTAMSIAEILPIPGLDNIDFLPFWTLLAWVALRKIKQANEAAADARTAEDLQKREAVKVGRIAGLAPA